MNSAIYRGWVRHRRFSPVNHSFKYSVFFLWIDLDELATPEYFKQLSPWFAVERFAALTLNAKDYLDPNLPLTTAEVWRKVEALGGDVHGGRVCLLGQVRCLAFYFSPVNFFYCYDKDDKLQYVLAEVSNTPWNERHCYLVEANSNKETPKNFHVSPFMSLDMRYRWRLPNPDKRLCLHIENHTDEKLFDATLLMARYPLTGPELRRTIWQIPAMSWHILRGIYWQALRLWIKRVPYVSRPQKG